MTGSSHITRAVCLTLCMGSAPLVHVVRAQAQEKAPDHDAARSVVDIDAEIEAMRRARESLSREMKEFEALLDRPRRPSRSDSQGASVPASDPGSTPPVRDVVDVDAELAKAREVRGKLSRELEELLQGLQGTGSRLQQVEDAKPELAALRTRVAALTEQLQQALSYQRDTEAARKRAMAQLATLTRERKKQKSALESVNQRIQTLTEQATSASTATATALTALERSYAGRLQAMRKQLQQARASQTTLRTRLGKAEAERDELKTRLAVASRNAGDARAADMVAQIKSLSGELASIRRESADARSKLEQAHRQQVQVLEQQLARLGSEESSARSRLRGVEAKGDALRKRMLEQMNALRSQRDGLAVELASERKALAVSQAQVATLEAERGKPAPGIEELRSALDTLRQETSRSRKTQAQRIGQLESEREALLATQQQLGAELAQSKSAQQTRSERADSLEQALTAARAELIALRGERETLQGEAVKLRQQLAGTGARSQTLDERLAAAGKELADARNALGSLRTEHAALAEELTALRAGRDALGSENEQLRQQLSTLSQQAEKDLGEARTGLDTLGKENELLRQQLAGVSAQAEKQSKDARDRLDTLSSQNEQLRQQLAGVSAQAEKQSKDARDRLDTLSSQNEQLRQQLAGVSAQAEKQSKDARDRLDTLSSQNEQLRQQLAGVSAQAEKQSKDARDRLDTLASENRSLNGQLAEVAARADTQRKDAEARLASLDQENDGLREQISTLQQQLAALQSESAQQAQEEPKPEAEQPALRTHVVQRGESLSVIARRYLGRADRWQIIYEANRERIANPNVVEPGTELVIPNP